ncbi:MAG TPA: hypothetical protein VGJ70_13430 [Solirubrobacteraceae bacterium]|jgi:hypothetical protein
MHASSEVLAQTTDQARRPIGVVAVIGASLLVALGGGALAGALALSRGDRAPALPAGPFGIRQEVPTSFGAVSVDAVEKLGGVAVHGPRNGIGGDVAPGQVAVRTTVSLSNLLDHAIRYTPAWFRLRVGARRRAVELSSSTMPAGRLEGQAVIDGRLTFVVPQRARRMWLEVDDPGRGPPALIDLGRAGRTPISAFDRFGHLHRGGAG